MRRSSEYTACYHPAVHPEGQPGPDPKPKRRRDGDDGGTAGTGMSYTPGRTGGMAKRGTSFKGKSPAKKSGGSQADGKGGSLSAALELCQPPRLRRLRRNKGVTEDQYLEFNRVKSARGSAECRKLRQKNLCFNCAKPGHSY